MTPPLWFLTTIASVPLLNSFTVTITTNVPCHLWLYWTASEPWTHKTTRMSRGISVPWFAYWCFVAWKQIEQNEAGDTTTHTFTWPDWAYCITRWFTFAGEISGITSPSCGPIFHLHCTYIPPMTIVASHTGLVERDVAGEPYIPLHDAPLGTAVYNDWDWIQIGQFYSSPTARFAVFRSGIRFEWFDFPPGAVITAATLSLAHALQYTDSLFDLVAVNGDGLTFPLIAANYGYLLGSTESYGSVPITDPPVGGYHVIPLNASGIAKLQSRLPHDSVNFGIRTSRDISALSPKLNAGSYYEYEISYGSFPPLLPRLIITYTLP